MNTDVAAATRFVHSTARLLERHRLAHLLDEAGPEPVIRTLYAYRNDDGGFGHAIEPDMRAPTSQPVGVQTTLEILDEVGVRDETLITGAADWLTAITRADGGIPSCLPSVLDYPRNPIWRPEDESSVIQTAANAAALHAIGARHPWLDGADAFLWRWIDALDLAHIKPDVGVGYQVRFAVTFLNAHPDATRAEVALDALAPDIGRVVATEPGGDVQTPLDFAPFPDSRARRMFEQADIDRHLEALAADQRDDGGWMFGWDQWNPTATTEWRGVLTLHALRILRRN
jgi:hypothetical protein